MRKLNLIGLALLLAACAFVAMDYERGRVFLPWLVFISGVTIVICSIDKWFQKPENIRILFLFVWMIFWALVSVGVFTYASFMAVSMMLIAFWHFYLYMALSTAFVVIAITNLVGFIIELKRLVKTTN